MATFIEIVTEHAPTVPNGYGIAYGQPRQQAPAQDAVLTTHIQNPVATETAIVLDAIFPVYLQDYAETAPFNDAVTLLLIDNETLSEVAPANDTATLQITFAPFAAAEPAQVGDSVTTTYVQVEAAAETAEFADAASTSPGGVVFSETAIANDTVAVIKTANLSLRETAEFADSLGAFLTASVSETAAFADAVTLTRTVNATVSETAVALDAVLGVAQTFVIRAEEAAATTDAVTVMLTANVVGSEEAFIADRIGLDDPDGGYIWTANMVTWAMSRYVGTPFTSMVDDFATTEDALVIKDGGSGNADVLSGDADVGDGDLARVRTLYMYGNHALPLTVDVTADVLGTRTTTSYTQMARDASDSRAVRCTLGRGYRSQHYQIRVQSTGEARMRKWLAPVDGTRRRV